MFSSKYHTILFFLLSCSSYVCAQTPQLKTWNSNDKLTWNDYKREAPRPAPYSAVTTCTNDYQYWPFYDKEKNLKFRFVVKCVMHKNRSWVLNHKKTDDLLMHEQLHFDISEYFARQMQKALSNAKYTRSGYLQEIEAVVQKVAKAREYVQAKYDKDTDHASNLDSQKKWGDAVSQYLLKNPSIEYAVSHLPD